MLSCIVIQGLLMPDLELWNHHRLPIHALDMRNYGVFPQASLTPYEAMAVNVEKFIPDKGLKDCCAAREFDVQQFLFSLKFCY